MIVENNEASLRELLAAIYVSVTGHVKESPKVSDEAWEGLCDTILDAAEGRPFKPLDLPWPQ